MSPTLRQHLPPRARRLEHASEAPGERLSWLEATLAGRVSSEELEVPPYSVVILRVQELMGRRGFGMNEVAALIGADASLATDVLRCANSSLYRRGAAVIDLTQALTRIGVQQVNRLLLAAGLADHAQASGPLVELRRLAWIEGIASAAICQSLARLRSLPTEEAFTLGLLHDFGKVVAVSGLESILRAGQPVPAVTPVEWGALLERVHVEVGSYLARCWKLPSLVQEVIAQHHAEGSGGSAADQRMLELVRTSDQIVALAMSRSRVTEAELAAVKGLTPGEREAMATVVEQIPGFVAAFETPAPPGLEPECQLDQPDTTLTGPRRPLSLGVSVKVANRARAFYALTIGPDGIELIGDDVLPVNRLLEAELRLARPVTVWLLSTLCRRDGKRFRVEARPFALTSATRMLWDELE